MGPFIKITCSLIKPFSDYTAIFKKNLSDIKIIMNIKLNENPARHSSKYKIA